MSQAAHDRRIDSVAFATRDLAAAKKFYAAAFGWVFTDSRPACSRIPAPAGRAPADCSDRRADGWAVA